MTSDSDIRIHQALHGYTDGHREIALSRTLSPRDSKVLLTLSDRSGPGLGIPNEGYLTGYPLADSGIYVVARTWPAPELPRPGCVWTHSLLIDFTDLATIEDTSGLMRLFVRPDSGIANAYHQPIAYAPGMPAAPQLFLQDARRVLAALYDRPQDRIIATTTQTDPDALVLCIWEQQWPRLRRNFRFCSLSAADRSTDSAPFDLQLLPPEKNLRSRFPKAHEAKSVTASYAWLEDALEDLRFPGSRGLRTFLRRAGSDVSKGRESFASLCSLHVMLERDDTIDLAIRMLDREFASGEARFARTAVVQAAATHVDLLDPSGFAFLLRNLELLGSEAEDGTLRNIGVATWHRQPEQLHEMLEEAGPAHVAAKAALESLPLEELAEGLKAVPSLAGDVLERRPDIVSTAAFWSTDNTNVRAALAIAGSNPSLAHHAAIALVRAHRADFGYPATEALGALEVGRAILAADDPLGVPQTWYEAVAARPHVVAELFASHAARTRQSLVQFARAMQPDSLPNDVGDDPWLTALASSHGEVPEHDNFYFQAFILARALGNRSRAAAELAINTFDVVHNALAQRRMPDDGWGLLRARLSWSWYDWDRCGRLREAVGRLFVDRDFSPTAFHRLTADDELFKALALSLSWSHYGRDYLRRVRSETNGSGDHQYLQRVRVLDRIL